MGEIDTRLIVEKEDEKSAKGENMKPFLSKKSPVQISNPK